MSNEAVNIVLQDSIPTSITSSIERIAAAAEAAFSKLQNLQQGLSGLTGNGVNLASLVSEADRLAISHNQAAISAKIFALSEKQLEEQQNRVLISTRQLSSAIEEAAAKKQAITRKQNEAEQRSITLDQIRSERTSLNEAKLVTEKQRASNLEQALDNANESANLTRRNKQIGILISDEKLRDTYASNEEKRISTKALNAEKLATAEQRTEAAYESKATNQQRGIVLTEQLLTQEEKTNNERIKGETLQQRLTTATNGAAASFNNATKAAIAEDAALAKLNLTNIDLQSSVQKAREAGVSPILATSASYQPQRDQLNSNVYDAQQRVASQQQFASYRVDNEGVKLSQIKAEEQLTIAFAQSEIALQGVAQGEAAVSVAMSEATVGTIKQEQAVTTLNLAQVQLAISLVEATKLGANPQLSRTSDYDAQRVALENSTSAVRSSIQAQAELATSRIQSGTATQAEINAELSLKNSLIQTASAEQSLVQGEIALALARSQATLSTIAEETAVVKLNRAKIGEQADQLRLASAQQQASNRALLQGNGDVAHSFELTGGVARELFVIFRELGTGNISLLSGSLVVLINRMGGAKTILESLLAPAKLLTTIFADLFLVAKTDAFGLAVAFEASTGVLLTVTAGVLALGAAIGYAFYSRSQDIKDFNATMALTGNVANLTRESFNSLAKDIASSTGESTSTAKTQLTAIISSGQLLESQYVKLGQAIASYSILAARTGQSSEQSTQKLISGVTGGASGILKLNSEIRFLTETNQAYIATHLSDVYESENRARAITDLSNHFAGLKKDIDSVKDSTFDLSGKFSDFIDKIKNGEGLSALVAWGRITRGAIEKGVGLNSIDIQQPQPQQPQTFIPENVASTRPPFLGEAIVPAITNATGITSTDIANQKILTAAKQDDFQVVQRGLKANIDLINEQNKSSRPSLEDPEHSFANVAKRKEFAQQLLEIRKASAIEPNNSLLKISQEQIDAKYDEIDRQNPIRLDKEEKAALSYAAALAKINKELDTHIADYLKLAPLRKEDAEIDKLKSRFTGLIRPNGGPSAEFTPEAEATIRGKLRKEAILDPITKELDKVYEKSVGVQEKLNALPEILASRIKLDPTNIKLYQQEAGKLTESYKDQLDPQREANILLQQQQDLLGYSGNALQVQTEYYDFLNKTRKEGLTSQQDEVELLAKKLELQDKVRDTAVANVRRGLEYGPKKEALDIQEEGTKKAGLTGDALTVQLDALATAKENLDLKFKDISGWDAFNIGMQQTLRLTRTSAEEMADIGRNFASGLNKSFADSAAEALVTGKSFTESFASAFKQLATTVISQLIQMAIKAVTTQQLLASTGGIGGGGGSFVSTALSLVGGFFGGGGATNIVGTGFESGASVGYASSGLTYNLPTGRASGGYAGDYPTDQVAGMYHGKEYVMNANATARNRAALEAMNAGLPMSGGNQAAPATSSTPVVIENRTTGRVDKVTERISPTERRLIIEEIASQWADSTSMMSKNFEGSYSGVTRLR